MDKDKSARMPHLEHFILAHDCRFRLRTNVGNYIVSTIGEMHWNGPLGWEREYETMVFRSEKNNNASYPYRIIVSEEPETRSYMTSEDATRGHYELCEKYSNKD